MCLLSRLYIKQPHGGKDGHPYPVNREAYDSSINFLKEVVSESKISESDKKKLSGSFHFSVKTLKALHAG